MKNWLKNAFATEDPKTRITAEDEILLDKLAQKVHQRGMAAPAVIFLESVKPLNFLAGQAMVFFQPIVSIFFNTNQYNRISVLLENRHNLEILLKKIEQTEESEVKSESNIQDQQEQKP